MKKRVWIPALVVLSIIIVLGLLYLGNKNSDVVSTDEPQSVQQDLEGESESSVIPTNSPTIAPLIKVGSRFRVIEVRKNAYSLNGYTYDLGIFVEEYKDTQIQGYCIDPGWRIPETERVYILKRGGLLVPKKDSVDHPLQRFIIIK
jgi:hypothetical protein